MEIDGKYMRRALELAEFGAGNVSPNPLVGAVVVAPDGRIIGEGWHRKYGEPHAEVNAISSVRAEDEHLISESTVYVTLEPCSHYGKTPPCSKLLIEKRVKRVVVGIQDPFKEVSGRGIRMLRDAGIEVVIPFMEDECREINRRFFTAHTCKRPYIMLKWCESRDGFIGKEKAPVKLSNPLSMVAVHRERSLYDAIMVGTDTVITDNPSLTNRLWSGDSPTPVLFESDRLPTDATLLGLSPILLDPHFSLEDNMNLLYTKHGVTSLMVEGGAKLLQSFIDTDLYDEIRVEKSVVSISDGIEAPRLPSGLLLSKAESIRENEIRLLKKLKSSN